MSELSGRALAQFDQLFREAPAVVDRDAIRRMWRALAEPYDVERWLLPLPVWARRRYDESGTRAWNSLKRDLALIEPDKPYCVYLHVPFCSSKCDFCDCYSFKLGSHRARTIQRYVDRLCDELRLWSRQGNLAGRPVSTVHMGGGTPTFLGQAALAQIVDCCSTNLNCTAETEWALESTVESLTPAMMETMHHLGFRRLHVGVQSLQEEVRAAIKRRRPVAELLDRISAALELDWIVSVDLICGLPLQSLASLVADIERLVALGVNGFSLYELLIFPQNRAWAESQGLTGRNHLANYLMFLAGAGVLTTFGYRKNLFNHWADQRDDNRYFTFPTRDEDCLALGAIADGLFGDYHYRHPPYAPYMRQAVAGLPNNGLPNLEGGLRRTPYENKMKPITTDILSGTIPSGRLQALQRPASVDVSLKDHWLELALVEEKPSGDLSLTSSGSWFAGNMIAEVMGLAPGQRFRV